jgi:hypothetical protein
LPRADHYFNDTSAGRLTRRTQQHQDIKVFLLLFLQKKKILLFLKKKKQKNFIPGAASNRIAHWMEPAPA